jgi:hypothetical protein
VAFTIVAIVSLSGCANYIGRAKKAYVQGRYLEVSEDLARHEPDLPFLAPAKQIDYGVYRGLSLIMLGDYPSAHRWLAFANDVEREYPGTMLPEQRLAIVRAFAQLSQGVPGPNEAPPQPLEVQ